jgi:hypothetical protein
MPTWAQVSPATTGLLPAPPTPVTLLPAVPLVLPIPVVLPVPLPPAPVEPLPILPVQPAPTERVAAIATVVVSSSTPGERGPVDLPVRIPYLRRTWGPRPGRPR